MLCWDTGKAVSRHIFYGGVIMSILEKDWLLFVTVAEEKNMTKAANKLFITQPALSYKINQIEKNFNMPLALSARQRECS